ncbi:ATP-binding protein [Microbulbifer thermotolerans]|uniref:sensor histidine kinase n=1 Tax=Microbulbifer thermotolerans TaxID=252514 RepID=UPI00224B019D|nr:ATP-binding protein [Microbulbifer thermotolerans]MCX2780254.1 ATP-binding protein [Microbulbifer thermotolerans]MCX2783878.1 ATP-binding protein [Microbulbifer thermotolerans]MCX2805792.1 ATP-binding protein [Microbulbifer thermotolerans]
MSRPLTNTGGVALQHQELLRVYAFYRVAIALVLLSIFTSDLGQGAVGNSAPALYLNTVIAYTALNLGWFLHLRHNAYQTTAGQVGLILGCDILTFLLLIQASGGLNSGLGYLLLVNCSVGSLLLDRRMSAFFAAVASIGVIGQQLYGLLAGNADTQDIVSAGSLGVLLFVAVSSLQYLSARIRSATLRADQQSRQAAHLQRLAQQIIERMRTGVLVLDATDKPELINQAARQLLGGPAGPATPYWQELHRIVDEWNSDTSRSSALMRAANGNELRLNFAKLHRGHRDSTLVFIEDNRKLTQAAQKLKLASLGHLTASIAHEIRNPLGAISHAAQLLSESQHLNEQDRQLTRIICRHSQRVNEIVENIMQLSRRRAAAPQLHDLGMWLELFVQDYRASTPDDASIQLQFSEQTVNARFDPQQLAQVVTNLCNNALHHSHLATGRREVELAVYHNKESDCAVLDVIDSGQGVLPEHKDKIFEPFFTTGHGGSGLGLYIARELCEAIQANLYYCRTASNKSCFRIEFAHSNRFF